MLNTIPLMRDAATRLHETDRVRTYRAFAVFRTRKLQLWIVFSLVCTRDFVLVSLFRLSYAIDAPLSSGEFGARETQDAIHRFLGFLFYFRDPVHRTRLLGLLGYNTALLNGWRHVLGLLRTVVGSTLRTQNT